MSEEKNVVIIFGSPRKNSNTHILMEEARKGITEKGIQTQIFYLNEMNIKGCQACYYCKRNNVAECAIKDDMQKIHEALKKADGMLITTPIYFGGVTAQTKLWLDRMFPFIDLKLNSFIAKGKKVAFIFTQNQPAPGFFTNQINSFKNMVGIIGFEVKGSLLAYNLDKGYKPLVTENREFMRIAYELGRGLLE